MPRTMWKKIIDAGALRVEVVYPAISSRDGPKLRAEKRKASTEAQQRLNHKKSWQQLELMLAANYSPGDLVVTLPYDDAHYPHSRAECERRIKYFREKLSKARGKPVVMFWNTENKHGDGRWHHHCVINATGEDYELIRRCWIYGSIVDIRPLRVDRELNYETLARYMCKEAPDKIGKHVWHYTVKTAKRYEEESFRVEADVTVTVPKGAIDLGRGGEVSPFARWQYVKYVMPVWEGKKAVKARRRRRK